MSKKLKGFVSSYARCKLQKTQQIKKILQSQCDNSSTTDDEKRPAFYLDLEKHSSSCTSIDSSDVDIQDEKDNDNENDHCSLSKSKTSKAAMDGKNSLRKTQSLRTSTKIKKKYTVSNNEEISVSKNRKTSSGNDYSMSDNEDQNIFLDKDSLKINKSENNIRGSKIMGIRRSDKERKVQKKVCDDQIKKKTFIDSRKQPKSQKRNLKFYTGDADSSSGKEFQESESSRSACSSSKRVSSARIDYNKLLEFNKSLKNPNDDQTVISDEQIFHFKSGITKILNKFKEVCTDFELRMDHVKLKHFKKDLVNHENAKTIVLKSQKVISELKTELDAQEKNLMNFYQSWNKECEERSLSSDKETLSEKGENLDEPRNMKYFCQDENSVLSDDDNEEMFSLKTKNSKKAMAVTKELCPNNSSAKMSGVISPILGRRIELKKPIINSHLKLVPHDLEKSDMDKAKLNDSLSTNTDLERVSMECSFNSASSELNQSMKDIFEDSTIDSTINMCGKSAEPEKIDNAISADKNLETPTVDEDAVNAKLHLDRGCDSSEAKESNEMKEAELSNQDPREKISKSHEIGELLKSATAIKDERTSSNSRGDSFDEEEQAKKMMLDSDPEFQDEELITENQIDCSIKCLPNDSEEKCVPQNTNMKSPCARKEVGRRHHIFADDNSFDEQKMIHNLESCAKRDLLDSNSDESVSRAGSIDKNLDNEKNFDNLSENVRAKTALLISSNSESSSSDNSNKSQNVELNSSSNIDNKQIKQNSRKRSSKLKLETSIAAGVKKRRLQINGEYNYKDDRKLQMFCFVVIERLHERVLENHKDALRRSRLRSDYTKIKSLLDLDSLGRNHKKSVANEPSRNLTKDLIKIKGKVAKETEETLLDYLKDPENGPEMENIEDFNCHEENNIEKMQINFQTNEELMMEADRAKKNMLLNSSDSDIDNRKIASNDSESEDEQSEGNKEKKSKEILQKTKKDKLSTDQNDSKEQKKNRWRRNKLLTINFSDTDSDEERGKFFAKQEKSQALLQNSKSDESTDDKEVVEMPKRRRRYRILDSDSDLERVDFESASKDSVVSTDGGNSSNSDIILMKKQRKTRTRTYKSSDMDSLHGEKKPKVKRKRIKKMDSDSDSDSANSNSEMTNSQDTPGKKGRKNIRKVMKGEEVDLNTKQAAKEEEERLKRIAERQKLYNEIYEAKLAGEEKVESLVLDFNPETKEEIVTVHKDLVQRLKPHQAEGIKFMWNACFESIERIKTSPGSGCIIAHCMGLGKSLQVITLIHTLLSYEETGVKTIAIVCPLSTVLNWTNEFKKWLNDVENGDFHVYELTKTKKNVERKWHLERWQETGGVLIIGYEMFRNLCNGPKSMRKKMKEEIVACLLDPGPDLIVCDEGHLLKNEGTALSKCMQRIKTLRRIVLTGTPLQNNLTEYHCMVQFVKPNLLGTKKEFSNRFVNPITNGQFDDSTDRDVKLMKKRAYVLHKMLKGSVQRFDYTVLTPFLPPKQEYVIFVSLTDVQIKMYQHYLDTFARKHRNAGGSLFADFQALQRIWTHPLVLRLNSDRTERNKKRQSDTDTEGSLKDFIDEGSTEFESTSTSSSGDESDTTEDAKDESSLPKNKNNNANENGTTNDAKNASSAQNNENNNSDVVEIDESEEQSTKYDEWWLQYVQPHHFEDIRMSAKLVLLFGILKECEQIGDKVLVFSQSLHSLTLIECFLERIHQDTQNGTNSEYVGGHSGTWLLGLDYFRLDGQSSSENRNKWCRVFNRPTNTRARLFLISTRAGGLGINLTAANRVIIFDASWNPSHDVQSIFRVYRFGQRKPCYIYRFLAAGTLEEKIYNRQVTKLSLSCRVVDVQQIDRHYSNHDLSELYTFERNSTGDKPVLNLPKDRLLAEIFLKYKSYVENYHEHDSLLENKTDEELDEEERKQAWLEYEEEKKGNTLVTQMPQMANNVYLNQYNMHATSNMINYEQYQQLIRKDYPNATPQQQKFIADRAIADMYNYWEQQAIINASATRMLAQNAVINQGVQRQPVSQILQNIMTSQTVHNNATSQMKVVPNSNVNQNVNPTVSDVTDDDVVEIPSGTGTSSTKPSKDLPHSSNKRKNNEL